MSRAWWMAAWIVAQVCLASTARTEETTAPARWFARAQLGLRSVAPSEQLDLLSEDGYGSSARFVIGADVNAPATRSVGAGGRADFSPGGATPPSRGPTLKESPF